MVIESTDLRKKFKQTVALDGLNFEIPGGMIYGLLGPNGAGKTTFINIAAGLVKADSGTLLISGVEAVSGGGGIKGKMGFVPQDLAIYEDLTAYENVSFFASLYGLKGGEKREKVERALEFVSLTDRKKDFPKNFSGGMKRRLNLACGICHEPEILFLDEPTVGIDPQSRNHIMESIRTLNRRGMTVIYTTHYMEEAQTLCDKIGIIDKGRIIAEGTLSQLQKMISKNELIFIEVQKDSEILADEIGALEGVVSARIEDGGVLVKHDGKSPVLQKVMIKADEKGFDIRKIESRMPNLEEVFLSMTGRTLRD
jgi:ABC-2 type transport system ATP-binding protein